MFEIFEGQVSNTRDVIEYELKGYFVVSEIEEDIDRDNIKIVYKFKYGDYEIHVDMVDNIVTFKCKDKEEVYRCIDLSLYNIEDELFYLMLEGEETKHLFLFHGQYSDNMLTDILEDEEDDNEG